MRRLLWTVLGSALTLLCCAIGWFVSGGWHTNEVIVVNYASETTAVSVQARNGMLILAPTREFISDVPFDLPPMETGFVVGLDNVYSQPIGYTFPCDFGPSYLVITKDRQINYFALSEGNTLFFLRRNLRCLLKYGK